MCSKVCIYNILEILKKLTAMRFCPILLGKKGANLREIRGLTLGSGTGLVAQRATPPCLRWCIWMERNNKDFEGPAMSLGGNKVDLYYGAVLLGIGLFFIHFYDLFFRFS